MVIAFHQETGRAGVAGIAFQDSLHVLSGLGGGADAAAYRVTSRAIPWRILEDTFNVALLATQSGMDVTELESGFGMIK